MSSLLLPTVIVYSSDYSSNDYSNDDDVAILAQVWEGGRLHLRVAEAASQNWVFGPFAPSPALRPFGTCFEIVAIVSLRSSADLHSSSDTEAESSCSGEWHTYLSPARRLFWLASRYLRHRQELVEDIIEHLIYRRYTPLQICAARERRA